MFINFCFQNSLKTATGCCQTEQQIQRDALGICANCTLVAPQRLHAKCRKWLRRNNG